MSNLRHNPNCASNIVLASDPPQYQKCDCGADVREQLQRGFTSYSQVGTIPIPPTVICPCCEREYLNPYHLCMGKDMQPTPEKPPNDGHTIEKVKLINSINCLRLNAVGFDLSTAYRVGYKDACGEITRLINKE